MRKNNEIQVSVILILTLGLLLASTTSYPQARLRSEAAKSYPNVDSISAEQLRQYVKYVAADEMEGRDTPSRGLDTVARFLALNLSLSRLTPSGDSGTYFQRIVLHRNTIDATKMRAEIQGHEYAFGTDFLALPSGGTAAAPLVYAGHGWFIKAKGINPYNGIDIRGKIVIVLGSGLPKGLQWFDRNDEWVDPYSYAQQHGAQGVIVIPSFLTLVQWDAYRRAAATKGCLRLRSYQH